MLISSAKNSEDVIKKNEGEENELHLRMNHSSSKIWGTNIVKGLWAKSQEKLKEEEKNPIFCLYMQGREGRGEGR